MFDAAKPNETVSKVRLAFWDEYTLAINDKRMMKARNVYGHVCHQGYFYDAVLHPTMTLAWVISPPAAYHVKWRELLDQGHKKLREVLMLPLMRENGEPNTALISQVIKIVEKLENRVQGAVPQHLLIHQQSLSLSMNQSVNDKSATAAEIQKEIDMIKDEMRVLGSSQENPLIKAIHAHGAGQVITVEATRTRED